MENSIDLAKMEIGLCKRNKVFSLHFIKIFHFSIQNSGFQLLIPFWWTEPLCKKVKVETDIEQTLLFLANFDFFLYLIFYYLSVSIYKQCFCKLQTLKIVL